MIRSHHRKIAYWLVKLKLWNIELADLWRVPLIKPCRGTRWLHQRMLKAQTRDGLHHAPACPGNEWSGMYLVLQRCNCGAARRAQQLSNSHRPEGS